MQVLLDETNEVIACADTITEGENSWIVRESIYSRHFTLVSDVNVPTELLGKRLAYNNGVFTELEPIVLPTPLPVAYEDYAQRRAMEYPKMADYLDGVVKGDTAQVQAYIDACLAVKAKYPKPRPLGPE